MRRRPFLGVLGAAVAVLASAASAQDAAARPAWTFSANAYWFVDGDPSFLLPVGTADRGALHLEARYNYEDLETFSGWVGWTLETGDSLHLAVTPMAGGIVGRTDGLAPGAEVTLSWRRFELYSESEYVFALSDGSDDYFYTWSQLSWRPLDWLRVGLSGQRLRTPGSELAVDFGPLVEVTHGALGLSAFFYNPFSEDAFSVLGASYSF